MATTQDYFKENKFVVVSNVISKKRCQYLTEHMFELTKFGATQNDDQCPLSDGIYGDPEFDRLLEELCVPIGQTVGLKLLPTYTYARVYRPGEILKKHKDRPSCQISATLTLGYNGKQVWPIFFDDKKCISANLEVGEMAIYKGCEVTHWRDTFKGVWHVQVFLHYVDANGPYKEYLFDKRESLSHHVASVKPKPDVNNHLTPNGVQPKAELQQGVSIKKAIFDGAIIPSTDSVFPGYIRIDSKNWPALMFTEQECDKIIQMVKDLYASISSVGGTKINSKVDYSIRSADIYLVENDEENRWIYEKVTNAVAVANKIHFDYEISGITHAIQLIHYKSDKEVPGHYEWHIDSGNGEPANRKISLTVQLSKPEDYEGCELLVNDHGQIIQAPKERGSINMFPSYQLHKVNPITAGERFALVIWIHGSRRFR